MFERWDMCIMPGTILRTARRVGLNLLRLRSHLKLLTYELSE